MWGNKPGEAPQQYHWEVHHEVGGMYQEVHLGQPPAGTFDPCQAMHEGHNL